MHQRGIYERFMKRFLDIILSVLAIVILSPVLLLVAVLVRVKLGKPVIFNQKRPGMIDPKTGAEKIFSLYKFRTMTDQRDENGNLLPDEVRLTKFGKALRSTSLDELPELINIVKGDMSFVGPRPLLVKYLPLYSEEQRRRHNVRPGITGLAQVNGRNSISWEEKFEWDVKYTEHVTFLEDIRILFKTVSVVVGKKGISSETSATMEEFQGNREGQQ